MKNIKELLVRVLVLFAGLIIAHFGVTLFLIADLGSDPFNVFVQGLYRMIYAMAGSDVVTHGRVHMVISILLVVVLFIYDRRHGSRYVMIGTFICMFFGGPIIDVFNMLLSPLFENVSSFPVLVAVNAAGCVILAFGMTIVIKSEAGTGPNDLVAIVISEYFKKRFSLVRVVVDVCFAASGFVLGGTVGIGTIICAFVVGPVAGMFMDFNESWIKKTVATIVK